MTDHVAPPPMLPAPDRGLAFLARHPRGLMLATVFVGAAIGWAWLAAMIAAMLAATDMAALGPGMELFNYFNGLTEIPESVRAGLAVLCAPAPGAAWSLGDVASVFAMWVTMVLAMMLPTAAPMLAAYAGRAEIAIAAGERPVSVLVPAAGYLTVWLGFAIVATGAQAGLTALRAFNAAMGPMTLVLGATTLLAAGVYQFTPLKQACLTRCRLPASFFAVRWSSETAQVYRLGLEQGLNCLGCCWALMAVMFAVGVMNVVWIAVLGLVMGLEKATLNPWVSRVIGVALIAWGLGLIAASPVGARLLHL
ncbi:DUF2182 domain-containing protein [Methyloraptor flagellatus]|uniref:DUF2182 domain-containing protein n=1 Tax=Methyloraptor flagellatus TaxID=3162530 RepID=A0AAU7XEX2_9HYPH